MKFRRRLTKNLKRHAILLEVMIAFALVVLCALPLMYSQAYILNAEQDFVQKIKLDHAVNLLYADFYERLQRNEFPWESFVNKTVFPVDPSVLTTFNDGIPLPFTGSYHFEIKIHKPKKKNEPLTLNLLKLIFSFTSLNSSKTHNYEYWIFAIRNLQPGSEPTAPSPKASPENPPSPEESKNEI